MNKSGTFEENDGLSVTMSEEDAFDALVEAVNSGDADAVNAVFSSLPATESDANDDTEDTPGQDDSKDSDTNQAQSTDTHSTDDADAASNRDTTQEPQGTSQPDELAQLRRELQEAKSALGRVPAMQSQLNQLQRELKIREKVQASKPAAAPVEDPSVAKLKERIAALKEIDEPTAEILEELLGRTSTTKPQTQDEPEDIAEVIRKATEEAIIEQEYNKVLEVHPDAAEIFTSLRWDLWKGTLTDDQRAWAESSDSAKVATAVTAFKEFVANFGKPVAAATTADSNVIDVTQQKRQDKLKNSTSTASVVVKDSPTFDPEAYFNETYEKALKDQGLSA